MITRPLRAPVFQPDELGKLQDWLEEQLGPGRGNIVFTNGCFDVFHAGHACMLQTAACKHGDIVIVGVNTDEAVRRLKGPGRPIMTYNDRVFLISTCRFVDAVIGFGDDPYEVIVKIAPDILLKGAEYEYDDIIGAELVKSRGGRVERFPMIRDLSTTQMIERLKKA